MNCGSFDIFIVMGTGYESFLVSFGSCKALVAGWSMWISVITPSCRSRTVSIRSHKEHTSSRHSPLQLRMSPDVDTSVLQGVRVIPSHLTDLHTILPAHGKCLALWNSVSAECINWKRCQISTRGSLTGICSAASRKSAWSAMLCFSK